jgi:hypothetical protein
MNIFGFYFLKVFKFLSSSSFLLQLKVISNLRPKKWHFLFLFSGQKFAMLELKSTISQILRSFKVIESDSKEDLRYTIDFILKSAIGLKVKLQMRKGLKSSFERLD